MENIVALMSFAFVMSVTPGPNNVLLMNSGLCFGIRRTIPHILGIQFGLWVQLILCAYGLGLMILDNPLITNIMRALGTSYLLYLAWQLRHMKVKDQNEDIKPFTFSEAALFQFINPKAWMMAVTAGALLIPPFQTQWLSIAMLCVIFSAVGAPSSGSWAFFGALFRKKLQDAHHLRRINFILVGLTLYTALSFWF